MWRPIDDTYEMEHTGLVRRKGNNNKPLMPRLHEKHYKVALYGGQEQQKRIDLKLLPVFQKLFPSINPPFSEKWLKQVRNKLKRPERVKSSHYSRCCTDCGQPTDNYRCDKCWEKLRQNAEYCPDFSAISSGRVILQTRTKGGIS